MDEKLQAVEQNSGVAVPQPDEAIRAVAMVAREACAYLLSLSPALVHREYAFGKNTVTIGREAEQCDIVCSGATVSRRHFQVAWQDGRFVLRDLNSTNGVFLNRGRVQHEAPLAPGDLIGIGSDRITHLRFELESGRNRPWAMTLPPKDLWTIGRAPACDIALAFEATVSSRHAHLRARNGRLELNDLGSLNGTWLNGRRVRRATLEPTDSLMIGSTLLRFSLLGDGSLRVVRRDCGEEIALECVGITREVGGALKKEALRILDRISLAIRPGEFVGLLGPSGAGKSTLLKALNGYNPATYGCVMLNEMPLYPCFDMFRNTLGYVPQDDIVHPELTVEKSLDYVARLRLPPDTTEEQRRELIDGTLETLGLNHVRGSHINRLSGGQRKRVSIGCELITRPSLLFLDEPTSGMDPSTEERLMRHFQHMARSGTTVLITTHILYNLSLLDRIVILSRGRLVFFGTPAEAMAFFTIDGAPVERPTQIFEILEAEHEAPDAGAGADPKEAVAERYQQKYRESELFRRHIVDGASETAQKLVTIAEKGAGSAQVSSNVHQSDAGAHHYVALLEKPTAGAKRRGSLGFFSLRDFRTLTRRNLAIKLVSPRRLLFYLAVPVVLALVTLSLRASDFPEDAALAGEYQQITEQIHGGPVNLSVPIKELLAPEGAADPRPAEDVIYALKFEGLPNLPTPLSVLLMFMMTSVFMGTLMSCLDLSTERPIYIRERMANQRIADYLASKLPFLLLVTALQCLVFLLLCRIKPGLQYFDFTSAYVALVAMAWAACAMGLFLSAIDPTSGQFSVILAIVMVLPQLVLSGALGPDFFAGMPAALQMIANLFPARWGVEMLMTAFYHHPDREALQWIHDFVVETVGFRFGSAVYLRNTVILLIQAAAWLIGCGLIVKRLDHAR
jgi:ABC transport system ATP-binding/permease protein